MVGTGLLVDEGAAIERRQSLRNRFPDDLHPSLGDHRFLGHLCRCSRGGGMRDSPSCYNGPPAAATVIPLWIREFGRPRQRIDVRDVLTSESGEDSYE